MGIKSSGERPLLSRQNGCANGILNPSVAMALGFRNNWTLTFAGCQNGRLDELP